MSTNGVLLMSLQCAGLFLIIWVTFRLIPSISANTKAWVWRVALLKPLLGLLPLAVVSLHVLPAPLPDMSQGGNGSAIVVLGSGKAPTLPAPGSTDNPINPWMMAWLLGTAVVAAKGVRDIVGARRIAHRAESLDCPILQDYLHNLLRHTAPGKKVQLLVSADAKAAMLIGGRRPAIILPEPAIDVDDARLIIAHELAHLLRRDLGWFGLAWVVQSIFFFNPFVWLAVRASHEAHESATDAQAIELAEVPASRYAEMLVRTLVSVRSPLVPGAAFMSGSYQSIHRRLETMKHFGSPSNPRRKAAVGALALAVACLMPAYQLAQASPPQGLPGQGGGISGSAGLVPGDKAWCWVPPLDPAMPDNLSCDFNHYDVRQALTKIFQRHKKNFRIDPRVRGTITIALRNVSLATGLVNITRQVGAGYSMEGNVYVIGNRPPTPPTVIPPHSGAATHTETLISSEFRQADAREVLRRLFLLVPDRSYTIDPMIQGTVTVSVKDVPFEVALEGVLRQVDGAFHVKDGTYIITRAAKPPLR